MAAHRASFMSETMAHRSSRLGVLLGSRVAASGWDEGRHPGLLLAKRVVCPVCCVKAAASLGCVRNISGMLRLSCVPVSLGDREHEAEAPWLGFPMAQQNSSFSKLYEGS